MVRTDGSQVAESGRGSRAVGEGVSSFGFSGGGGMKASPAASPAWLAISLAMPDAPGAVPPRGDTAHRSFKYSPFTPIFVFHTSITSSASFRI